MVGSTFWGLKTPQSFNPKTFGLKKGPFHYFKPLPFRKGRPIPTKNFQGIGPIGARAHYLG